MQIHGIIPLLFGCPFNLPPLFVHQPALSHPVQKDHDKTKGKRGILTAAANNLFLVLWPSPSRDLLPGLQWLPCDLVPAGPPYLPSFPLVWSHGHPILVPSERLVRFSSILLLPLSQRRPLFGRKNTTKLSFLGELWLCTDPPSHWRCEVPSRETDYHPKYRKRQIFYSMNS